MCPRTKPERITPVRAMTSFRPIEELSILWRRERGASLRPTAGLEGTAAHEVFLFLFSVD